MPFKSHLWAHSTLVSHYVSASHQCWAGIGLKLKFQKINKYVMFCTVGHHIQFTRSIMNTIKISCSFYLTASILTFVPPWSDYTQELPQQCIYLHCETKQFKGMKHFYETFCLALCDACSCIAQCDIVFFPKNQL